MSSHSNEQLKDCPRSSAGQRQQQLLNRGWVFAYGDMPEAKEAAYDDSNWYTAGIPHSFGTPYFMENTFYVGYGCYRKRFSVSKEWLGRRLSLEFQGVFQEAEVYVNGALAGRHQGGYTAFEIDISSLVREGGNLLFVRVNNLWNPRLAPRAGEHVFNGGIYRDVSLIVTDPLHVAWYGTYVTTPQASSEEALVEMRTEVANRKGVPVDCTLVSTVEYEGRVLLEIRQTRRIDAYGQVEFLQQGMLASPQLWHPDTPRLYILRSCVYDGEGELRDTYETRFGVRWFRFDAHEGFFLNGEHYDILGANAHQDHAGWGDAVTRAGMARDVRLIKECGMNLIRGSHYPHHPHVAAECDRQGLLFWSELCYWGIGGANVEGYWSSSAYPVREADRAEFEDSCMRALEEMIRTNRNHPSIVVWSVSNEPFFSEPEVMDAARALTVRLVGHARTLDSSRPAAVGGAQREGFDTLGDLAGYNGDGAALYRDPGFPSFVSEYGSVIGDRPGVYAPGYTDGVETNPRWRSGKALWCGFHHGSIAGDMGRMGMIDYYRLPLGAWYWYRNERLGIAPPPPARRAGACALELRSDRREIATDGTDDAHLIVQTVDEQGRRVDLPAVVTLEVVEGGGIFPTGRSIELSTASLSFLDGMGAIELRSYYAGRVVVQASSAGLRAATLELEAYGEEAWAGQRVHMPEGPPSRLTPPRADAPADIALHRPVFCSSQAADSPAMHVTDARAATCWRPASGAAGEWLAVDLEGTKQASLAHVTLDLTPEEGWPPLELACSSDGRQYAPLPGVQRDDASVSVSVALPAEGLRYLRIRFPQRAAAVRAVSIWS
ncbi:beta-galactosidase [Paenibacillus sp. IB182496]|uniref:Beta-galactosidase n=1 Tax=Paenibacillus sabuli TaxID=2772509 RepID=A0A927BZ92_9BACL|nr:glycoside hydrolase family 2 TIM barrel-domain containing protein [Paenibacillus sabuli]MBD2848124.1 beta-galactosidase [Paenibacillus sabuli]